MLAKNIYKVLDRTIRSKYTAISYINTYKSQKLFQIMSASNDATDILYSNPVPNVIFDPVPNVVINENFETRYYISVGSDGGDVGGRG